MTKMILAVGALALLGSILMIHEQPIDSAFSMKTKFEHFKLKFNKKYTPVEDAYRLSVYAANLLYAQDYNSRKGEQVFGETKFFDLTDEEFQKQFMTLIPDEQPVEHVSFATTQAKSAIDWVKEGYVTRVKSQGNCGACWTFGTTGVLEGFFKRTTGNLISLSEKQLLDCSRLADLNLGCRGGMPSRALNYVKRNGITTEAQYPYVDVQEDCKIKGGDFKIQGHQAINPTENDLIGALQLQPVSIGVDARNWKYYDPSVKRVFSDCGDNLEHAVLAVGYDSQTWKVKNSWSTDWGVDGYIYLARGNTCGLLNTAVIPI